MLHKFNFLSSNHIKQVLVIYILFLLVQVFHLYDFTPLILTIFCSNLLLSIADVVYFRLQLFSLLLPVFNYYYLIFQLSLGFFILLSFFMLFNCFFKRTFLVSIYLILPIVGLFLPYFYIRQYFCFDLNWVKLIFRWIGL